MRRTIVVLLAVDALLLGLIAAVWAAPSKPNPIIVKSPVTLNCPLGVAAGTGDDTLTCSTGETLTFTRASGGYACPKTALEDTSVTTGLANNAPCYVDGYGIGLNYPVTNKCVRSESIDNAAWATQGTPIITADSTVAPDGNTTADTLQDDDIAISEGVTQGVGTFSGPDQMTLWAKSAGTVQFRICDLTGTDTCSIAASPPLGCCSTFTTSTAWQRFRANVASGGTSQTHQMGIFVGAANADVGTIQVWGAQTIGPKGNYADPYCPSTGAAATTCAAEYLTVPAPSVELPLDALSLAMDVRPFWRAMASASGNDSTNGGTPIFFQANTAIGNVNERQAYWNVNLVHADSCSAGAVCTTLNTAAGQTLGVGVLKTMFFAWGGGTFSVGLATADVVGVIGRSATDATPPATAPSSFQIGGRNQQADAYLGAFVSNVVIQRPPPMRWR